MIVFDYPVFRLAPCAGSPTLHLFTGFRLREPNGAWVRKTFSRERMVGGGEQEMVHPELWEYKITPYVGCKAGEVRTNTETIKEEADIYLDAWKDHWDKIAETADI